MDKLSTTVEDYLSLIYVLQRDNLPVVGTQLADYLGVTPPTVTNTLKRMARDGLVISDESGTRLTEEGWDSARTVVRRHMLTEWMMVRRLPWSKLHAEAHNLEHAISAEAEAALLEELGHPQTCPHGNPLPGSEEAVAGWIPLTKTAPGDKVIIRRIHELAEQNGDLMGFLEKNGVLIDVQATVTYVLPFNQTITIKVPGGDVTLGFAAARYVYVEPD
ncbi:MAG TPA: metal-dependent transcriptional regulator [Anaerolineales bacterium]|nr:metal-dependent transcriptional regulator [Anaerolineales bacterium]